MVRKIYNFGNQSDVCRALQLTQVTIIDNSAEKKINIFLVYHTLSYFNDCTIPVNFDSFESIPFNAIREVRTEKLRTANVETTRFPGFPAGLKTTGIRELLILLC